VRKEAISIICSFHLTRLVPAYVLVYLFLFRAKGGLISHWPSWVGFFLLSTTCFHPILIHVNHECVASLLFWSDNFFPHIKFVLQPKKKHAQGCFLGAAYKNSCIHDFVSSSFVRYILLMWSCCIHKSHDVFSGTG